MEIITANLVGRGQYRTWQNRHYFVAPIRMLVPGVLNGSMGPLLYPEEEVKKDPETWNGMPMVAGHPAQNGQYISARNPVIIERTGVGNVYYAKANPTLDAEGWFDVEGCRRVDQRILVSLEERKPIEVSTGLVTRNYPAPQGAVFNGKDSSGKAYRRPYVAIARDYKPDHLAILMDTVGACSTKDGCGVMVSNAIGGGMVELPKPNEITPRARQLGADAVRQGAQQGEVPDWVTDVILWAQSREMADAGSYEEDLYFAAVAQIYLLMSGKVGRSKASTTTAANANPGQPKADDGKYKLAGSHAVRQAAVKGFGVQPVQPVYTPPVQTATPPANPSSPEEDERERQRHSPAAVFGVTLNNTPNPTPNPGAAMQLTDQERTRIIDGLVANCACETTKNQRRAQLAQQTDDTLKVLHDTQGWNTPQQGTQQNPVTPTHNTGQGGQQVQTPANPAAPVQTPAVPQQTHANPAQVVTPGSTNPLLAGLFSPVAPATNQPMSMDQWIGAMPPQAREVWNASQEIFNAAKMALIGQLVANVQDVNQRQQLANYYATKPLEELKMIHMGMMASMPAPQPQQPPAPTLAANWFGAAGGNPTPAPVTEAPLTSPVYNFAAAREATKHLTPTPAVNGTAAPAGNNGGNLR